MIVPVESKEVCIAGVFGSGTNVTKSVFDEAFGTTAAFGSVSWKHPIIPALDVKSMAGTQEPERLSRRGAGVGLGQRDRESRATSSQI